MTKKALTDRFIRSRKPAPTGTRLDYHDAVVPGLALRVTDRGHKSFVLHGRFPAKPEVFTRRTLGDAYVPPDGEPEEAVGQDHDKMICTGALSLSEARRKARAWLDMIGRGVDPKIEEARERALALRRQAHTFGAVADQFIARHVKGPAQVELEALAATLRKEKAGLSLADAMRQVRTAPENRKLVARASREGLAKKDEAERIIQSEFIERWAFRPIGDILPEEVATAVRAIVKRGAPYQAHNAFGLLRRLYNWAIGTNEFGITSSPVEHLRPADLIGKREARDRVLTDEELREVWSAAETLQYPSAPLFKMLILTGQRRDEVAHMAWSEVDTGQRRWTVPAERMKGKRAHEVPLGPDAMAILVEIPRFNAGPFVFSTTSGEKPVNGFSKVKARLDKAIAASRKEAGKKEPMPAWKIHDLRRTMRTHLSALPVEDLVRELVIAHAKTGLHKVYDQHQYRDEKQRCLELWESRLKGILNPPPDNVADLAKARATRQGGASS